MPLDQIVTTLLLRGTCTDSSTAWKKWVEFALPFLDSCGTPATHLGAKGDSFKGRKVLELTSLSHLRKAITRGEHFSSIEFYSLPQGFQTAAFDYLAEIGRRPNAVYLIVCQGARLPVSRECTVERLRAHIAAESACIFEMERRECPMLYILEAKPASAFRTLKLCEGC